MCVLFCFNGWCMADTCSALSSQRHPEGGRHVSRPPKEDPQQRPDDACTDEPDTVSGGLTLPRRAGRRRGGVGWVGVTQVAVGMQDFGCGGWRTGFLYKYKKGFVLFPLLVHFPLSSSFPAHADGLCCPGSAVDPRGPTGPWAGATAATQPKVGINLL